jgi:putative phosphoesterase
VKLGLISDVHGDPAALGRALGLLDEHGVDRILCAGDVVDYGPDPAGAVAVLRERGIATVRGNHDRWAVERGAGAPDPYGGGASSAEVVAWLAELPPIRLIPAAGRLLTLAHGTPGSDMEFVTPDRYGPAELDALLEEYDTDVLVIGHTHAPMWYAGPLGLVVNPGSVVGPDRVDSSRTAAVLDVAAGSVEFVDLVRGERRRLAPWTAPPRRASG